MLTLGQTGTQQTRNLLDEGIGSDEGVVLASQLLDELLVLVQLLQVIGRHGVDTAVLGSVDIVLITENAIIPNLSATLSLNEVALQLLMRALTRCSCWGEGPWAA